MTTFRSGYVTLMGPANAGKSTLLNKILGEKVSITSPKAQTTRARILGVKHLPDGQLIFLDTPGFLLGKPNGGGALTRTIAREAKEGAAEGDVRVLVIDAEKAAKRESEIVDIASEITEQGLGMPTVVATNKIDIVDKGALLPLLSQLSQSFPEAELIPVSARTGDGVELLLQEIKRRLPEGPAYFPEDQVSDQSERKFVSEIIRERLIYNLRDELPYSTAVMIEEWEEAGNLLKVSASIAVERDGQKGIVIGKQGAMLKRIGTEARTQIEKIFQCKVFLQLHVRVVENWTMSDKGLSKVGVI